MRRASIFRSCSCLLGREGLSWFTTAALSRAGLTRKSLKLTICEAPSELDEVGVTKPFAIIEKRNDFGDHPDQEETFFPGQCVSQDLGKLPEHKLAHAVEPHSGQSLASPSHLWTGHGFPPS